MEECDNMDKIFDADDIVEGKTYYTALSNEESDLLSKHFAESKKQIEKYYASYREIDGNLIASEYPVSKIVEDKFTIMELKYLLARELRKNLATHPGAFYKGNHYAVCEFFEWCISDKDIDKLEKEVEDSFDDFTRPKHGIGYFKDSEKTANEYTYIYKSDLRRLIEELIFLNYVFKQYCNGKGENNND